VDVVALYEGGQSISQVATQMGWGYEKTRRQLRKAGAVIRSPGEGVSLARRAAPFVVTPAVRPLVDGLLLGDGSIERGAFGSRLRLNQCVRHRPWVDMVMASLTNLGIEWGPVQGAEAEVKMAGQTYQRSASVGVRTRSYGYFTDEHDRWYPSGVKRVPRDVDLSPVSIAHWYFGDGMVGNKGYHAQFATDGFPVEDVELLIERLHGIYGWRPTRTKRNRILISLAADRKELLEMVRPLTPECFSHKLRLKTNEVAEHQALVLEMRGAGLAYSRIVEATGMSKSQVASICKTAGLAGYTSRAPFSATR
jgi:hypothetical protein